MDNPVILFDGVCNLCNGAIKFVLRHDKKGIFRFASLQSEAGKRLLATHDLDAREMNSFFLIERGKVYKKSAAALKVVNYFAWYWKELQILRIVPYFLRDAIYDFIAANRYKWFGKRDQCMVPTPDLQKRFLQ
ncbi:MAG TPA: thiol-disulfide oxidoreductase DCC family protein [Flavisolibacter sp.]|nr:thiol-disulfide oxidoreductase DCC family protein [Flavisolibacter sp.]